MRVEPIADQRAAEQYVIDEIQVENSPARSGTGVIQSFDSLLSEAVFLSIRTLYTGYSLPNRIIKMKKIIALMLFLTFFAHANDSEPAASI